MGPWTGFRVVLNAEERLIAMGHGCHGSIVEVQVGDFNAGWQRLSIKGKTVVLTCDLHLPCRAAGVIETAVTEIKLERGSPESQAQDLMTETDAKQR